MKNVLWLVFILMLVGCNFSVDLRGNIKEIGRNDQPIIIIDGDRRESGKPIVINSKMIITGEEATKYLNSLNLEWESTGLATFVPSQYYVNYENGFILVYSNCIIVGNGVENQSYLARISSEQSDNIKIKLGIK